MEVDVRHDPEESRYVLLVEGRAMGAAEYEDTGEVLVFFHTEVDRSYQGRGLGSRLVRGALDDVRRAGRSIVPRCPFVARFVDRHPDYADLVSD